MADVRRCYVCDRFYEEVFPTYQPDVPLCPHCFGTEQTLDLMNRAKAEAHSRYVCYFCCEEFKTTVKWRNGDHRMCLACSQALDKETGTG